MTGPSVLFVELDQGDGIDQREEPACFHDLNLDQVVAALTAGREAYRLASYFWAPLTTVDAVAYRQEVFRDLERGETLACLQSFAGRMRALRDDLAQANRLRQRYQRARWFLDAVGVYGEAVQGLRQDLHRVDPQSRGLRAVRGYLDAYVASASFTGVQAERTRLAEGLAGVHYCLHIDGNRVTISRYEDEADYAAEVLATFARFRQDDAKDYHAGFHDWPDMNHVEAGVLERVALLYPELFQALEAFEQQQQGFLDGVLARFDRELQFYLAYREYIRPLRSAGLPFCYPAVSDRSKEVAAVESFDLALAAKLVPSGAPVITNDFALRGPERILVVSGPNQGGKTTFARTFGQMHLLACLGCPVPGREARLLLFDALFTHFEREEDPGSQRGKLEDDLLRLHALLEQATPRGIVIINEIFTSTTFRDARFLGRAMLERITALDLLCVCVTFVDELASLNAATVSMVSTVVPGNPAVRTFKIVRRPADGRAYALAIAEKYGLTYERLRERIAS